MTQTSPLAEASPKSLEDYFNANPKTLTPDQRLAVVLELRRQREAYDAAEQAGKRVPRAPKAAAVKMDPQQAAQLSLSDLGI